MQSKVSIAKCGDYSRSAVEAAVQEVLGRIGGMGSFVSPGQSVLLKPNMLTDREPDCAVTTHPEVVRALILQVRKLGGKPCVADSPTNVTKIERVWERTGFRAMCEEESVPLLNLEKSGSSLFSANGISFSVATPVLDADVIINVPKIKTHMLTIYTGAVKNLFGTIPGFQKASLHQRQPSPVAFAEVLAALYGKVRPSLSVADAIVGMDGEGPSGGRPVKLGFLAASADGVALDAALCRLLGIDLRAVSYLQAARRAGVGETEAGKIDLLGTRPEELKPASFRVPSTIYGRMIPAALVRMLAPLVWIRPAFTDRCVSCGRCVKACPAEALRIETKRKPVLTPKMCIGCCCCHEVCPEKAIEMAQSPFLNLVRRGRLP